MTAFGAFAYASPHTPQASALWEMRKGAEVIRTSLSLHRGTAHGASTLGVLDDEGIEVAAISGTSVGELNRNALVSGMESTCRDYFPRFRTQLVLF